MPVQRGWGSILEGTPRWNRCKQVEALLLMPQQVAAITAEFWQPLCQLRDSEQSPSSASFRQFLNLSQALLQLSDFNRTAEVVSSNLIISTTLRPDEQRAGSMTSSARIPL